MSYEKPSFRTYPQLHWLYMYIAGKCNLRCKHCWIDPEPAEGEAREGEGYLPYELFLKALDEAAPLGLRGVKYTGGEPLLHPRFAEMLREGKSRGLSQMVETNGTLITPELANVMVECTSMVAVSLDGATAETHDSFRGVKGAFEQTIKGLESLRLAGVEGARLELICTLRRSVVPELQPLLNLADSFSAGTVKFNVVQPIGRARRTASLPELAPEDLLALRALIEDNLQRRTRAKVIVDIPIGYRPLRANEQWRLSSVCRVKHILGILATGTMALCGVGYETPRLRFGSLRDDHLPDVWARSPFLAELRDGLPRRLRGICAHCALASRCLGACAAANFVATGELYGPHWFCKLAAEEGRPPLMLREEVVEVGS